MQKSVQEVDHRANCRGRLQEPAVSIECVLALQEAAWVLLQLAALSLQLDEEHKRNFLSRCAHASNAVQAHCPASICAVPFSLPCTQ